MKKISYLSIALRTVLTVFCILLTGFIFYNSIQTGETSAKTSEEVTVIVQEAV